MNFTFIIRWFKLVYTISTLIHVMEPILLNDVGKQPVRGFRLITNNRVYKDDSKILLGNY